jgi:hypothetical protein
LTGALANWSGFVTEFGTVKDPNQFKALYGQKT